MYVYIFYRRGTIKLYLFYIPIHTFIIYEGKIKVLKISPNFKKFFKQKIDNEYFKMLYL